MGISNQQDGGEDQEKVTGEIKETSKERGITETN